MKPNDRRPTGDEPVFWPMSPDPRGGLGDFEHPARRSLRLAVRSRPRPCRRPASVVPMPSPPFLLAQFCDFHLRSQFRRIRPSVFFTAGMGPSELERHRCGETGARQPAAGTQASLRDRAASSSPLSCSVSSWDRLLPCRSPFRNRWSTGSAPAPDPRRSGAGSRGHPQFSRAATRCRRTSPPRAGDDRHSRLDAESHLSRHVLPLRRHRRRRAKPMDADPESRWQSRSVTAWSRAKRRTWNGGSATTIGKRTASAAGCSREIGPDCDRHPGSLALQLRDDADSRGSQRRRANAQEPSGAGAWPVGIALIWSDLLLPTPQTAVVAALGIIYRDMARRTAEHLRPDHRWPARLRADAHFRTAIGAAPHKATVPAQDGEPVRPRRRVGHRPHPQPSVQRTRGHGLAGRSRRHADQKIHRGADPRQRAHGVRLCGRRRRLGRPAGAGSRR